MVRYLVAAAGAVALMTGVAMAQTTITDNGTTKVITRTAPNEMGSKRVIVRRHEDRYGNLVTHKKIIREGLSGSSVTHVRKSTDPMTGVTTKERSTELR